MTGTGENVERTTAAGKGHTKTIGDAVVIISDDDVLTTMMVTLTDNGNGGGIQVRTTSGVITIESEESPWSETLDLVVGDRVLQNGNAVAALRAAKNENIGTATPKFHIVTIGHLIAPPRVTILRTVRVERSQGATAPQALHYDASPRLAQMRTRKTRLLLKLSCLPRTSLQLRLLFATLPKASLVLPFANHVLPTLQTRKSDRLLRLSIHPKWINTLRPIMTLVWTSHQPWPLMDSCPQAASRGGIPCYKSFVYGGRKRRRGSVWRNTARPQRRRAESSMTSLLLNIRSVDLPESGMKGKWSRLRSVICLIASVGLVLEVKHTVSDQRLPSLEPSPVEAPFSPLVHATQLLPTPRQCQYIQNLPWISPHYIPGVPLNRLSPQLK